MLRCVPLYNLIINQFKRKQGPVLSSAVWCVEFLLFVNCYHVQRRPSLILGRKCSPVKALKVAVADPTWVQPTIATIHSMCVVYSQQ